MKKTLGFLFSLWLAAVAWPQSTNYGHAVSVGTVAASGGGGSGTVTSVSWTGGIVSVATPTTTPAFTLAGTSGGVPFFSSTSTWATSALLTSTALMAGGGAGAAPSTPSATTTLDGSGNIVTPGSVTTGSGGSSAGFVGLGQGTAPSTGTTNIKIAAPASVTSYVRLLEGAVNSSGFYFGTVSGTTVTDTKVGSTGSGVVMLTTSPDIATSLTTSSTSFTAWAGATTLLTLGGTGASASTFAPSTLDATSSTTGAIRTSGGISAAKALNVGTTITGGGNLTIGTSNSATVGTVELGAASDTTLSRSAAGVLAVEGVVIPSISSTNTLTNKRVTARSGSTTSSATPTINTDNVDFYVLTAQAADITSFTTNLSGTPVDGDQLEIRVTGTAARAITWGTSFVAGPAALPTTTTTTKTLYVYFEFDSVVTHWVCMFSGSLP